MEMNNEDYIEINSLETIKNSLQYLLREVHAICEENGLIYNLFGGTMLGAVRHKGMIPWDDDIDITMPRGDYEKFVQIVNERYSDKYEVYVYPKEGYAYPFAKFILKGSILQEKLKEKYHQIGLYVDVFPVDGYPTHNEKKYFDKLRVLKHIRSWCLCIIRHDSGIWGEIKYVLKVMYSKLCEILGVDFCVKREIALARSHSFEDSDYILCQGAGWYEKGKLEKKIYLDRKLYEFNGDYFWGISNYHDHLTSLYGDYMKMPPVNQRVSNHDYKLYIEKSVIKEMKGEQ